MNVALVATQVGHIDSRFTVPHLNVLVNLAARQKHQVVCRVETNSPYNGLVALQSHFEDVVVLLLLQVWTHHQLYLSIVGTSGNKTFSARPVDAVKRAYMVVGLVKHHVNLLSACILHLASFLTASKVISLVLLSELGQSANFECFRIGAKDEVVAAGTEATGSYGLVVPQNGELLHVVKRRVNHGFNVRNYLHWCLVSVFAPRVDLASLLGLGSAVGRHVDHSVLLLHSRLSTGWRLVSSLV